MTDPPPMVSYSEISTFRDCPLKWKLSYVDRLTPPTVDVRLDRGTAWHALREAAGLAEIGGGNAWEAAQDKLAAIGDWWPDVPSDEVATLRWMLQGYHDRWASEETDWQTLETEWTFAAPMPVPSQADLVYVGMVDAIRRWEPTGETAVVDFKSASKRDVSKSAYVDETLLLDQFPMYAAARRRLELDADMIVWDIARTDMLKRAMTSEERFNRVVLRPSDLAHDAVWNDASRVAEQVVQCRDDPDRVWSVPNPGQCGWKCQFMAAHVESRHSGRDLVEVALGYGFVQGDASGVPVELADVEW